jgi:histone H3/H4
MDMCATLGRVMAEKISEEQLKPLAQRVADEAEPRTKEVTQQYLREPAKQVAEQVTRDTCTIGTHDKETYLWLMDICVADVFCSENADCSIVMSTHGSRLDSLCWS